MREREYEVGVGRNSSPISTLGLLPSFSLSSLPSVFPSPHSQTSGTHSPAPRPYPHPSQPGRWVLSVTEGGSWVTYLSLCPHTWPIYKPDSLCSESSQMLRVSASGTFSRTGSNCNEFLSPWEEPQQVPGLSSHFYTLRRNKIHWKLIIHHLRTPLGLPPPAINTYCWALSPWGRGFLCSVSKHRFRIRSDGRVRKLSA